MTNSLTLTLGGSVELVLRQPPPDIECVIETRYEGFTARGKGFSMAYTLPADKMITVRVDYVDAQGHPAVVDGDVSWDSSAPEVATATVDPGDSHLCTIVPGTTLGTTQVSAHADADLGSGVRALVTTLDVTTVAGEAVAGTISPVGDPQPLP
jgi:hypothetical protein